MDEVSRLGKKRDELFRALLERSGCTEKEDGTIEAGLFEFPAEIVNCSKASHADVYAALDGVLDHCLAVGGLYVWSLAEANSARRDGYRQLLDGSLELMEQLVRRTAQTHWNDPETGPAWQRLDEYRHLRAWASSAYLEDLTVLAMPSNEKVHANQAAVCEAKLSSAAGGD